MTSNTESTQIAALEAQLGEKDALVQLLTERLEQAAEQLDRMQRSGIDRRRPGPQSAVAAGIPPEAWEEQRQTLQEIQQKLADWESTRAAETLSRIEAEVLNLRDLVEHRSLHLGLDDSHSDQPVSEAIAQLLGGGLLEEAFSTRHHSNSADDTTPADHHAAQNSQEAPAAPGWDAIKQGLLAQDAASHPVSASASGEIAEPDEPLPDLPAIMEFGDLDRAELEAVINQRDAYIGYLVRKLRTWQQAHTPDWHQFAHVPAELTSRLDLLSRQLEELLRLSEVEMSLERARCARDQARMRQQQELLEKQTRELGLPGGVSKPSTSAPLSGNERRWLRFLGNRNT